MDVNITSARSKERTPSTTCTSSSPADDVIYAEGATAETFGSQKEARDQFDNFYEYYRMYQNEDEAAYPPCAPFLWGDSRLEKAMQPLRHSLEPWVDMCTRRDKIQDRLAARAEELVE